MIWLNGSFEDTSKISSSDRGFLLGDGVFETLYATNMTDVAVVFFRGDQARGVWYFPKHRLRLGLLTCVI